MTLKLSQKEKLLLQDQQKHEKVCVDKYQSYASQAQDSQLKQLFTSYAQQEQQHLDTVTQMLSGQVPAMSSQQPQQQTQQQAPNNMQNATTSSTQSTTNNQNDSALCSDMLMTEKFVSGAYDTTIFEFADSNARQVLNHIQKEEQEHGQGIFQYMQSKGMYNPQ